MTSTDASAESGSRPRSAETRSRASRVGRGGASILKSRWGQRAIAAGVLVVLVALAAFGGERWANQRLRKALGTSITAIHRSQVEGLKLWAEGRKRQARGAMGSTHVTASVLQVLEAKSADERQRAMLTLHEYLDTRAALEGASGFLVADPTGKGWAFTSHIEELGIDLLERPSFIDALRGDATLSSPFKINPSRPSGFGDNLPSQLCFAPIKRADGTLAGVLGLRLDPAGELSRVLELGRIGETGETIAFDRTGTLVSRSRFGDQLRAAGLIKGSGVLEIELKDPGQELESGNGADLHAAKTRAVAAALAGGSGQDIDAGWRDYRGHAVVGNWSWVPELRLGIVTKVDRSEAYAIITAIHWAALALIGCLALAGGVLIVFAVFAMKLESKAAEVMELGQYKLLEKIGEGGMGAVYRAEHSLLARPTALKLLKATTADTLTRFEREVKHTASLSHPNTIAIYDYGFNDSGTFYYAMELLEGTDLERLVREVGPLPAARALHIVKQVLGSLGEAHDAGLVHRDIKPANIMLTRRGGIPDFVKVLDFGLVRPVESAAKLTGEQTVIGTPLYLAPELLTSSSAAGPRSDIYAVGAVLYYLLSGRDAFEGSNLGVIISKHLTGAPTPLASVIPGGKVPEGIEQLLSSWLAKSAASRPESARAALAELELLLSAYPWTESDARAATEPRLAIASAATELAIERIVS